MKSVYIISAGDNKYKIGVSSEPEKRLKTLNIGSSEELSLIYVGDPIYNAFEIEGLIHKKLKEFKLKREWFVIKYIQDVKEHLEITIKNKGKFILPEKPKVLGNLIKDVLPDYKEEIEHIKSLHLKEKEENERILLFIDYLNNRCLDNYGDYTKLIYKLLFNKSFKDLKEEYGIKPKESLRDYLPSEQLKEVEHMEMLVSSLINLGWDYKQIKEFINIENKKMIA